MMRTALYTKGPPRRAKTDSVNGGSTDAATGSNLTPVSDHSRSKTAASSEQQREEGEDEECAPRKVLRDLGQPTAEEVEEHRIDHLPFRSWCPFCMKARATGRQLV